MRSPSKSSGPAKIPIDMTPMIDCVFQLIIFFMLTLKIKADEGDFQINMPLGQSAATSDMPLPDIKVRLFANPDGTLSKLQLGQRNLGNDERAFRMLNQEILNIIGRPGAPLAKDVEVEIDPDYGLDYQEVVRAITACTGRSDPKSGEVLRYVEKIKFARPRKPAN